MVSSVLHYLPFSTPLFLCVAPAHHPYNLRASENTSTSLTLNWTEPDSSTWNGVIRHYIIHVIEPAKLIPLYTTFSASTSINITGLNPYTTYEIKVAAVTISAGPYYTADLRTGEDGRYI